MADLEIINAIIAAGTTISTPAGIGFKTIVGFVMPSVWASGALTFRVSPGGVSFLPYVDVEVTAAPPTPSHGPISPRSPAPVV
jgi:hypothetical protein